MTTNTANPNENAASADVRPPLEVACAVLRKEAKLYAKVSDPETRKAFESLAGVLSDPKKIEALTHSAA